MIAYHPYREDSFALLPDDSIRISRYDHIPGQPALAIDGKQRAIPGQPVDYGARFKEYIQSAMSESSFFDLRLSGKANPQQCSVFVTGRKLDDSPGNANLRLYCVVTEDSLVDQLGGISDRVPRKFLPDVNGIPFLLTARLDSLADTLTFLPDNFRLDKLSVAAFVQDVSDSVAPIKQAAVLRRFY